jgi:hypothetical protein
VAAILIQSHFRRAVASISFQKALLATTQIQKIIRGYLAIQQTKQLKYNLLLGLNQKHVGRSGSIELILNEFTAETADETLTQYSETSIDHWDDASQVSLDASSAQFEEDARYQDRTFSRCGLSDDIHEMLIESGKLIYDCVGDPEFDVAVDLLRLMEMSEEYSGVVCFGSRKSD